MSRTFLPLLGSAVLLLAGCGGSGPGVSTGPGAHGLSAIQPPPFVPGPLDGQRTPRKLALRRPLAVIVENYSPDSRPQSGLGEASLVFETLAEGGVTRFMAVYLEHDASSVGPVRSTRMYFDHWAAGLHAILAHVGGNDDAQALLWDLPRVFNVDENRWEISLTDTGTPLFWRSASRLAPHNMYTSTYVLRKYAQKHGQNWSYQGASLVHKAAAPLKARGHATTISISFQNPLYPVDVPTYDVQYTYDRAANLYRRYMGGSPHVDPLTGHQISPANVVVMQTANAVADAYAGPTPQSILIPTLGTGTAWYFMDGHVMKGTWQQQNENAPIRFLTSKGKPVAFDPGQTWVETVPSSSHATWTVR